MGRAVEDTATGRRRTLRAIASYGDAPRPVAWLRPPGGGAEWTTDPALAVPAPIAPDGPPRARALAGQGAVLHHL